MTPRDFSFSTSANRSTSFIATPTRFFSVSEATLKLRNTAQMREGKISIYELPLDMAHMLRGLSNRKEIFGQIFAADPLKDFIKQLHSDGHTGSLEILTNQRYRDDPASPWTFFHGLFRD